jgi:hypothetical protein
MEFDLKSVVTAVVTTVVLAVLAWGWLQFTIYGRAAWQSLGQSEAANRWVAVTACVALVLGLVALLGTASSIWSSRTVVADSKRIGKDGVESPTNYPDYFRDTQGEPVPEISTGR